MRNFALILSLTMLFHQNTLYADTPSTLSADVAVFSYDIDGDGKTEALTDALLIMRYLFGFRGNTLTDGAVSPNATRSSCFDTCPQGVQGIQAYIEANIDSLDVDGDDNAEALSDALLIMRYYFGFRGGVLTDGAVAPNGTRKIAAKIEAFLEASFIDTPSSVRCTSRGLATYTFKGGVTGIGTVFVQPYSGQACTGTKQVGIYTDNNITYSLVNIDKTGVNVTAEMTIVSIFGTRTRTVKIKNGIISL